VGGIAKIKWSFFLSGIVTTTGKDLTVFCSKSNKKAPNRHSSAELTTDDEGKVTTPFSPVNLFIDDIRLFPKQKI